MLRQPTRSKNGLTTSKLSHRLAEQKSDGSTATSKTDERLQPCRVLLKGILSEHFRRSPLHERDAFKEDFKVHAEAEVEGTSLIAVDSWVEALNKPLLCLG